MGDRASCTEKHLVPAVRLVYVLAVVSVWSDPQPPLKSAQMHKEDLELCPGRNSSFASLQNCLGSASGKSIGAAGVQHLWKCSTFSSFLPCFFPTASSFYGPRDSAEVKQLDTESA